jgi:enoyl-CoA hydratase/carnithine racemase
MADYDNILVEQQGSLGLITLNQPEARNPLNPTTASELLRAFRQLWDERSVRSVAVTGAGKAFCAGGDLRQMGKFSEMKVKEAFDWPAPIIELNRSMLDSPKPVMAAVNGPAYAGGMGLAGMCDIVLATEEARFAMPEAKIGIFPMIIVAQLCRSLPRKHFLEMMFTGEPMSAAEGHRLGFVNQLFPDRDAMMKGVTDYARKFEQVAPDAVRLGRRAFSLMSEMTMDDALTAAQFFVMPFHLGEEIKEGADAFLNRRPADWSHPRTDPPAG